MTDDLGSINRQKDYESRAYGPEAYKQERDEHDRLRECVVCKEKGCTDCGELVADRGQWLWARHG